jgi:hypothetical protein
MRRQKERPVTRLDEGPALDTPEKEADLIQKIQAAQSNQPGRPL